MTTTSWVRLGAIHWNGIKAGNPVNPNDEDTMREVIATVDVRGGGSVSDEAFETGERVSLDDFVRQLTDVVPNPWQAARMAKSVLVQRRRRDDSKLLNQRISLSEVLRRAVKADIDAEAVFRDKVTQGPVPA